MSPELAELALDESLASAPEADALLEQLDVLMVTAVEAKKRLAHIRSAIETYDPSAPEASHLRNHQGQSIEGFCEIGSGFSIEQFRAGEGFSTLLPTGSGKTVEMTEKIRMLNVPSEFRSLVLVPRLTIQGQTVGEDEDSRGIQAFAPNLSIGRYGKGRKALGKTW